MYANKCIDPQTGQNMCLAGKVTKQPVERTPGGGKIPDHPHHRRHHHGGGGGGGGRGSRPGGVGYSSRAAPGQPFKSKANSELTDQDIRDAQKVETARIFADEGEAQAVKYLKDNKLNYDIDTELSGNKYRAAVLVNRETGKPELALRGSKTAPSIDTLNDWWTNLHTAVGTHDTFLAVGTDGKNQIQEQRKLIDKIKAKYGQPPEIGYAYSKGGGQMIEHGDRYNFPTKTFDPFITVENLANRRVITGGNTQHEILRTEGGPATALLGVTPRRDFKVRTIAENQPTSNPARSHAFDNYLQKYTPGRDVKANKNIDMAARDAYAAGQRLGEHVIVAEMDHSIKNGKSFTEFMRGHSPKDVDTDGDFSRRIEQYEQLWKEHKGPLTPREVNNLEDARTRNVDPTNPMLDDIDLAAADVNLDTHVNMDNNPFADLNEDTAGMDLNAEDVGVQGSIKNETTQEVSLAQAGGNVFATTPEERAKFRNMSADQKMDHIQDLAKDMDTKAEIVDTMVANDGITPSEGIMGNIKGKLGKVLGDNAKAVNIGGGLIAGLMGNSLANAIDPKGKLGMEGDAALGGAMTSGIAVTGSKMLSGGVSSLFSAATAGELFAEMPAGAAGMATAELAGKATYDLLKKAGASESTAGESGAASSGAVGGASTVLYSAAGKKAASKVSEMVAKRSAVIDMTELGEGASTAIETAPEGAGFITTLITDVSALEAGGGVETGPLGIVAAATIGSAAAVAGYTYNHTKAVGRTIETDTKHAGRAIKHFFSHL